MPKSKVKEAVEKEKTKEGLPKEAFAIVEDPDKPDTWKLPHHTRAIFRHLQGRLDLEKTVDWDRMPAAAAALSPEPEIFNFHSLRTLPEEAPCGANHIQW